MKEFLIQGTHGFHSEVVNFLNTTEIIPKCCAANRKSAPETWSRTAGPYDKFTLSAGRQCSGRILPGGPFSVPRWIMTS